MGTGFGCAKPMVWKLLGYPLDIHCMFLPKLIEQNTNNAKAGIDSDNYYRE
jgi:hypothetical protein